MPRTAQIDKELREIAASIDVALARAAESTACIFQLREKRERLLEQRHDLPGPRLPSAKDGHTAPRAY